jgi:hypothetical protein
MTILLRSVMFLLIIGLTSCYELQSDEELREDIIGTWKKVDCKYPYGDYKDVTSRSLLEEKMTFDANGSMIEDGQYPFCCETQCDTVIQGPCRWIIGNGSLTILPLAPSLQGHLNRAYPILCLKGDRLVFDNINIDGVERTKTCYCRE